MGSAGAVRLERVRVRGLVLGIDQPQTEARYATITITQETVK